MANEVVDTRGTKLWNVEERYRHRSRSITYQLEWVLCGKSGCSAKHGPYWYAYWTAPAPAGVEWFATRSRKCKLYLGRAWREVTVDEVRRGEHLRYSAIARRREQRAAELERRRRDLAEDDLGVPKAAGAEVRRGDRGRRDPQVPKARRRGARR